MAVIRWWRLGRRPRTGPPQRRTNFRPFRSYGWGGDANRGVCRKTARAATPAPHFLFTLEQVLSLEAASIGGGVSLTACFS